MILKVDHDFMPTQDFTIRQDVTLAGGTSQNVTFYITPPFEGTVKVTIDKLSADLKVL